MEFDKNGILNRAKAAQQTAVEMDEGLRAYMLKVYNYMATGILLTGIVALLTFKMSVVTNDAGSIVGLTSIGNAIYMSGLKWLVMLAPLGIVFYMSFGINKMSASKAQTTAWGTVKETVFMGFKRNKRVARISRLTSIAPMPLSF